MTDSASAESPVAIDRVDRGRGDGDGIRLRLMGRWLGTDHPAEHEALLVIQLQGRRHRFPASREDSGESLPPGAWEATFTVPSWAEPSQLGQAALWIGNAVVPVPLPGSSRLHEVPPPPRQVPPAPATPPWVAPAPTPPPMPLPPASPPAAVKVPADPSAPVGDRRRDGPLAELLSRESVSALHAELEQRSGEAARLRGALADAQSELEARSGMQAALESAHGELRGEVQELMAAVGRQREEFEQQRSAVEKRLSAAESDRDRVRRELDSERARAQRELDAERTQVVQALDFERTRAQRELESERTRTAQQLAELAAARDALAGEAAALREQLAIATISRDGAAGEVAGLRAELERLGTELAVTREQLGARGGDLGEAQRLLADARALTEQLRGQTSQ
jgi:hypothetical protein